jgi:cell pole-organizing protein PopZ
VEGVAGAPAAAGILQSTDAVLDQAVAELLRPLLRQWLDENMPRIVETALKVELADSVKASLKRPGST